MYSIIYIYTHMYSIYIYIHRYTCINPPMADFVWPNYRWSIWLKRLTNLDKLVYTVYIYIYVHIIPVVPHKAVAEVSKIGNL